MGNVPPLDVSVRGVGVPGKRRARRRDDPPFGGSVSPGTPAENIDALLKAAREWGTRSS